MCLFFFVRRPMDVLSADLLFVVLSFVGPAQAVACTLVSHRWRHPATSDLLWTGFYRWRWGGFDVREAAYHDYRTRSIIHTNWLTHRFSATQVHNAHNASVEHMCWTPCDGGKDAPCVSLFTASRDGSVIEHLVRRSLGVASVTPRPAHQSSVWCVAADEFLVASGGADATVRLWDRKTIMGHVLTDHGDSVFCVGLGPTLLASGDWQGVCILRKRQGFGAVLTLQGHHDAVWRLQLSEERGWILTASWDENCCLWDLTTGQIRDRYHASGSVLSAEVRTHESELWALDDTEALTRWDLRQPASDSQSFEVPGGNRMCLVDGDKCAVGLADGGVTIFDLRRLDFSLVALPSAVPGVCVINVCPVMPNPDHGSTLLAAGYYDGQIALWDFGFR